jgi:hypothetical protein
MIRRGSWVARFPGEHSLSLGTPGLHDESPLGFGGEARRMRLGGRFLILCTLTPMHPDPVFPERRILLVN